MFECVQWRGAKCVVFTTTSKKKGGKLFLYQNAVKWDMGDVTAKRQHGANFAPRIHMLHKPAGGMKSS